MKYCRLLAAFAMILLTAGTACADLDVYLNSLNVSAEANMGGFRTGLGVHFGASGPEIDLVMSNVNRPGDAALCLWLGRHSQQPLERVVHEYQANKKQGWGVLAKRLGIKPGSDAFNTLKKGDLGWHPESNGGKENGKGKGNSKGKGRKK
jgi:ABC-type Zn2+ transport system substrate-binding protein/surface adhesin